MAPFDDLPLPHLDPVARVGAVQRGQRTQAIRLPPGVLPPAGQGLLAAWQRRRRRQEEGPATGAEAPEAAAEAVPEVAPPETYDAHGERLNAQPAEEAERPRLDLEA
ncbi:MAG TPA: hypothetical protein VF804_10295 [Holophagaceae bacterium]